MRHIYRVSAEHSHPEYAANSKSVLVSQDRIDKTFSAMAAPYGCGKSKATAEDAIRSLLGDNGCTRIVISGPFKSGPDLSPSDL